MPNNVHKVARFLAADEGGYAPPVDVMDWLAEEFRKWELDPTINLTQALGLGNGAERLRILERMKVERWFYAQYEVVLNKTMYDASQDMANNIQHLAANYDNPNVPSRYRLLFNRLKAIDPEFPKQDTVYKDLRNKNADFFPNDFG